MRYLIVLLFFTISYLSADSISNLLEEYKSESELSKKTKDENAGHLTVYTRDDLERMQVESLKDLLKSMKFFRYLENRVGRPDVLNMDPVLNSSKSVRIYLNENELVLPIYGSGMEMFGNMDMDFIDHVELYIGFPSFDFGVEPATIVIRLYTKVAQRDSGSRVKFLLATNNSHKENIYTSGITESDMSYFFYANHSDERRDTQHIDTLDIKRDTMSDHFYASLAKDNYKFEFTALKMKNDAFLGTIPYATPNDATLDETFINAAFGANFLDDDSLSFNTSYVHSEGEYDVSYPQALPVMFGGYSNLEKEFNSDVLTMILKKKFQLDKHAINIGLQYRYKSFNLDDIKYDSVQSNMDQAYDKENIYSLFIEDAVSINENNLIGLSYMKQYYNRNKSLDDESLNQLRLSYIYTQDAWTSKTFASRQEFVPEPYMIAAVHVGNTDLDPEIYSTITSELAYTTEQTKSKLLLGYGNIRKYLVPNNMGIIQNSNDKLYTQYASAGFEYNFRQKDKLELIADFINIKLASKDIDVDHYNYTLRMINTISKFDIFNELIINNGYEFLDTGYDYSAGIRYAASPDLHISLKGENIFDKGLERKYYYNVFPQSKTITVPVIEQKFLISVEYLF